MKKRFLPAILAAILIQSLQSQELDLTIPSSASKTTPKIEYVETSGKRIKAMRVSRILLGSFASALWGTGYYFNHKSNLLYNEYVALPESEEKKSKWNDVQGAERNRNIFYGTAGGCAAAFTVTFFF